jgi:hypothetical protein
MSKINKKILDGSDKLDGYVKSAANDKKRPRNSNSNRRNHHNNKRQRRNDGHTNRNVNQSLPSILFILDNLDNLDDIDINDIGGINDINNGNDPTPPEPIYICPGKFCDHDPESQNVPTIPKRLTNIKLGYKITLNDLVELGICFHCKLQKTFHEISLERLAILYEPLVKLETMIGMNIIKENFTEQIVYFLLDLEPNPAEMLHTILVGPPGIGKSHVIDLLADIYLKMGYLTKNIVKKVKIDDLKGKYIGHTAPLTQKAIDEAMGGILVIDEAYSLASAEKLDSFSKELIDTLNRNLTENAGKFVCIIAGYDDQIEKCLFAHNIGLRSRFRFRFVIDTYKANELLDIFILKVNKDKWIFHPNVNNKDLLKFFNEKYESFKYFGRDMETLLFHTKVAHSNRIFFDSKENTRKITLGDLMAGYQRFIVHNNIKNDKNDMSLSVKQMYL